VRNEEESNKKRTQNGKRKTPGKDKWLLKRTVSSSCPGRPPSFGRTRRRYKTWRGVLTSIPRRSSALPLISMLFSANQLVFSFGPQVWIVVSSHKGLF
jgi:hypothetical protein